MMRKNGLKMGVLLIAVWLMNGVMPAMPSAKESGAVFYVAPNGSDHWSGTLKQPNRDQTDGPFATLYTAQQAIRKIKAEARLNGPATVYIREGLYLLENPLVFTPEDSGTDGRPITFAAYPGEEPVISGGRLITGFELKEPNAWSVVIPSVKDGQWIFRQLFVNDERRQRSRSPNSGYYHMIGKISEKEPHTFQFREGDIRKEWLERGDVELIGLANWTDIRMPLTAVDETAHTAVLAGKIGDFMRENNERYWIENNPDGLDKPGEWYLDRRSGVLTYLPLPGEKPEAVRVIAPHLQQVVRLEGRPTEGKFVEQVRFQDLTFCHTDWPLPPKGYADMQASHDIPAAFYAVGAVSCAVERCRFIHLGNYAVEFAQGCKENRIVGNEMSDLGAGGVKIGEGEVRKDEARQSYGNRVTDNHIYDIGIVFPAAVGVWVGQSSYNHITHNHIHDTYYTGISVGWTWGYGETNTHHNRIEYNHVHHIGRGVLSDMGGIYTLGVQPGTVIRNNLFHDVNSYDYGGWGIYPDEGSTNILIENNVVYRTKSAGFHQHYGKENIVRNNIFAFGKDNQLMRTRMEKHLSFTFERNLVYWKEGKLLGSNWTDDQYKMDDNLYWNASGENFLFAKWSWTDWQKRGQDLHSLIADPLFKNPDKYDFSLRSGSPARLIGFQPIDLRDVGPRKEFAVKPSAP